MARAYPLALLLALSAFPAAAVSKWNGSVLTPSAILSAPGDLDPTFGEGGKATALFFGQNAVAFASALQADGKIIAAGFNSTTKCFSLARFNTNGTLDETFGAGGKVSTSFNSTNEFSFVQALAIQADHKIVAAGLGHNSFGVPEFALARYMPDGSLDPSFGAGGKVRTGISGGNDEAKALVIQPDGKILAVGSANQVFAVVRYNIDGSLDNSFGSAGKVTTEFFESSDTARDVVLQPDGKIVVAGHVLTSTGRQRFALVRYNSNGALDTSFGTGGKLITVFNSEHLDERAFAIALQNDSKIIAGGWASGPRGGTDFALARYNSDGTLDSSFGSDGKVTTDFLNLGNEHITDLRIQPDGKIIAGGFTDLRASVDLFAVARYNQDGNPDNSFGQAGKVTTTFSPDFDSSIKAIELQPDGKFVAVGIAFFSGDNHFALARYTGDQFGTPTPTPSPTPSATPTPSPAPLELLIDDSGPLNNHVAALESSISLRDPFSVYNQKSPLKVAIDPNTRVTVFVRNLQLPQGDSAASVIIRLVNSFQSHEIPASDVRAVLNTDFAQVTFRLPDHLLDHDWNISIKAQGQETQSRVLRVRTFFIGGLLRFMNFSFHTPCLS